MAKLLGQDILTQVEFDEFKTKEFDRLESDIKATHNLFGELLDNANKAKHRANIALVVSSVALIVSVIALLT